MSRQVPLPAGVHAADLHVDAGRSPTPVISDSLSSLAKDLVLYTPALVHLATPLTEDPFDQYCSELGRDVIRYVVNTAQPVLYGLTSPEGDGSWNFCLHALPKEDWPEFRQWFGTCAYFTRADGVLRRVRTQELRVLDPGQFQPELVSVTAFVLDTNKGSFYFTQIPGQPAGVYTSRFNAAMVHDDTVRMAAAYAAEHNNPYGFVREHTEESA